MKIGVNLGVNYSIIYEELLTDAGEYILTGSGEIIVVGVRNDYPLRIPMKKVCQGYYLRWHYNGWHYWFFLPGKIIMNTEGENYRTIGTRKITMGSGQITLGQCQAIRTIMNTREIAIFTDVGWKTIRIEPGSLIVFNNQINGYEIEFTAIVGSREISTTGYSPVEYVPEVTPPPYVPPCEVIIGTQIWMCNDWDSDYPGSKVYNNDEANRLIYGGLYTHNQVMASGFCPKGWHVPSVTEYETLIDYLGTYLNVGGFLKEAGLVHWDAPNTGADNSSGFTALGAGFFISSFLGLKEVNNLWTCDSLPPANTRGYLMQMTKDSASIAILDLPKEYYFSVRLLKDFSYFADWFLPSTDELAEMYSVLKVLGVGGFSDFYYWSSNDFNTVNGRGIQFSDGSEWNGVKAAVWSVRACRYFITNNFYWLTDIGPAGGRIFHIINLGGGLYGCYEAAPSDQSVGYLWSNIVTAVPTSVRTIGNGQPNTLAIIGQAGHVDSAAKLCDDLIIYH